MKLPVSREQLASWPAEARREAEALLVEIDAVLERNPLAGFEPHSESQREFLAARTDIIAAFAGNRFGKSTALVVRALIECLPVEFVPEALLGFKRFGFDAPCSGWILCPSDDKIKDSLWPAFKRWTPREAVKGGDLSKAYNANDRILSFERGDTITFKTYKQGDDTLGGAGLHWVAYDEPPPAGHRNECLMRLADSDGYEMFAMTPLKVNTGWIRRDIFKRREAPEITVVTGSIHDNPTLDERKKNYILSQYSEHERGAREHGHFLALGGLVYPDFERTVVDEFSLRDLEGMDVVVVIDPGLRNAAILWLGFDRDGVCWVFDEVLLQRQTTIDYVLAILRVNARWGIGDGEEGQVVEVLRAHDVEGLKAEEIDEVSELVRGASVLGGRDPEYWIDPAARSGNQVNAETVQSSLAALGVYAAEAQNKVEAGIDQVRQRIAWGRLKVCRNCRGLRDEADDYAEEETEDGSFKIVKANDHRVDALRYGVMTRPFSAFEEDREASRNLGWEPDRAPAATALASRTLAPPLGSMS